MKITNVIGQLPRAGTQDTPHSIGSITKIVVHHDAGWRSADYDSVARYRSQANGHIGRGEDGLQYHYRVDNVGEVFQTRELTDTLWHAANYPVNRASIAICVDGDFTQQTPTREQYTALKELLDWLCNEHPEFPADEDDVFGHKEFSNTACPGSLINFVQAYRSQKEALNIPQVPFNDGTNGAKVVVNVPQTAPIETPVVTTTPTPFVGDKTEPVVVVTPVPEVIISTPPVEVPKETPMESKKFSLNKADVISTLITVAMVAGSAVVAWGLEQVAGLDFGTATVFVVPALTALLKLAQKYLAGK